jgi:hypothetical protein
VSANVKRVLRVRTPGVFRFIPDTAPARVAAFLDCLGGAFFFTAKECGQSLGQIRFDDVSYVLGW